MTDQETESCWENTANRRMTSEKKLAILSTLISRYAIFPLGKKILQVTDETPSRQHINKRKTVHETLFSIWQPPFLWRNTGILRKIERYKNVSISWISLLSGYQSTKDKKIVTFLPGTKSMVGPPVTSTATTPAS